MGVSESTGRLILTIIIIMHVKRITEKYIIHACVRINVYICAYAVQCHLPPVPHHETVAHNLFKMLNQCHGDVTDSRVDVSDSMMS